MAKTKRKRLPADEAERYGFRWGPVDVTRIASDHRGRMLDIATEHRSITVWISNGGRSLRVYSGARELVSKREKG